MRTLLHKCRVLRAFSVLLAYSGSQNAYYTQSKLTKVGICGGLGLMWKRSGSFCTPECCKRKLTGQIMAENANYTNTLGHFAVFFVAIDSILTPRFTRFRRLAGCYLLSIVGRWRRYLQACR